MANRYISPGKSLPWLNDTGRDAASGDIVPFGGGHAAIVEHDTPAGSMGQVSMSGVWFVDVPAGLHIEKGDTLYAADGELAASGDVLGVAVSPVIEGRVRVMLTARACSDGAAALERRVVGEERLLGTWVEDGVDYDYLEKIINVGSLPNNTSMTVQHNITNKVRFVEAQGFAYGSNNLHMPFANADGTLFIYLGVGNNNITITTNSDRSGLTGYVYLRFIRART